MKSHLKKLTVVMLSYLMCLLLISCNNAQRSLKLSSSLASEEIDDGSTNQAAKINCDLYLNSSSSAYRTISTISSTDTFSENAKEGDSVKFDCSKTEDEDSADELSYSIDTDYSPSSPSFEAVSSDKFTLSDLEVGRHSMAIKAVDTEGKERVKTFTLVVECVDAQTPVLNTSGVSITASSRKNYFNYAINPSSVSGGSGFQYAWDFNGDGVFDPYSLSEENEIWTSSSTLSDIYSIFVTEGSQSRQISVKVKNNCEKESTYTIEAKFPSDNIERVASSKAVEMPYFYIQADISGASSNDLVDQRKNGDVLVTQYPTDTSLKRIECDYKKTRVDAKAVFTMKAYNYYKEGSDYQHGMEIQIQDINDLLTTGTQEISDANLAVAKYQASAADDGIVSEIYSKNTGCTLTMRIIRQQAIVPCASDEQTKADYEEAAAITILGEFSCPSLQDSNTLETVSAENGKFFCQVAPSNQCVGGGGGGGGVPVPEQ